MGDDTAVDRGEGRGRPRWRRALVTGASSGIGSEFCRHLAADGTDLVVVARTRDRLDQLAAELTDAHGIAVEVLTADLTISADLAVVEERVAATDDRVDLLVNNAGFGINGKFSEIPVDDEESEIKVNVVALLRLAHAAVGQMTDSGGGGILNVSSIAGFQPGPRSANYSATKAFVTSFSQAVHEEARGDGIHVTALCPGLTRTEFQSRGGYDLDGLPNLLWQEADEVARVGLDAVAANRAVVVSGLPNKATAVTMRLLPMGAARRAAALVTDRTR
jgi:short-subunit dehydrogenase